MDVIGAGDRDVGGEGLGGVTVTGGAVNLGEIFGLSSNVLISCSTGVISRVFS